MIVLSGGALLGDAFYSQRERTERKTDREKRGKSLFQTLSVLVAVFVESLSNGSKGMSLLRSDGGMATMLRIREVWRGLCPFR